jgi:hypothetical protein
LPHPAGGSCHLLDGPLNLPGLLTPVLDGGVCCYCCCAAIAAEWRNCRLLSSNRVGHMTKVRGC